MALKKHLCAVLKARLTGQKARLHMGGELLDAFIALSSSRSYGMHGPNPITWEAVAAWSRLMQVPVQPHHAEIIMALDEVWMNHAMQKAPEGVKTLPPISQQPLTAALFDISMS